MNLIEYWPPYLQQIREFEQIALSEQPEIARAIEAVSQAPQDFYLTTLTEYGVSRWEKILEIQPKPGETLVERRFTVHTRLIEMLPFTMTMLEQQLELLCGPGGYDDILDHNRYTLTVYVALTAKSSLEAVERLLYRIVPANMIIVLLLKYNRHEVLNQYTHAQLAAYTHINLRNEVLA